jgi:hypothetical protein
LAFLDYGEEIKMTQEQQQWLIANPPYEPVGTPTGNGVAWASLDFLNPNGSLASNPTTTPLIALEQSWTGPPFVAFAVGIRTRTN